MPEIKSPINRYKVLDRCFSDRSMYYFIDNLCKKVNDALDAKDLPSVSKRTVYQDIKNMESNRDWNVVFEKPGKYNGKNYYRYDDPNYSIWNDDINERQLGELKSLLLLIRQFQGLPQFEEIEKLIEGLEEKYKFKFPSTEKIISFGTNEYVKGLEYLAPLFDAISSKQPLSITYQPYGKNAFKCVVHPYFLKQHNNRWFLFGKRNDDKHEGFINMALDRIQKIGPSDVKFVDPPADVDFEEYFDDIIGVTTSSEPLETIVLRVAPARMPYILTKPLHPSQRDSRKNEGIITIEVKPNRELYQLLLSFGSDIEVLEPLDIREQMAEYAKSMAEKYR